VKGAESKALAERARGPLAKLEELALSDLVGSACPGETM
jgi:hypothetical protein